LERVIAYIDGYNLYYGLKSKGWKRYYWLNLQTLIGQFIRSNQELVLTKYFTTVVKLPNDKRLRQVEFLDALKTLSNFEIYYGQFLSETITCRQCGHSYTTYHEKMTDVNISVELMSDAFQNRIDTAFLLSADSDLTGTVETVHRLLKKRVVVIFPPGRSSYSLKSVASAVLHIGHLELAKSLFLDEIAMPGGVVLKRPATWH
jgi:uncharacterized LabA/DUF88 family protein